MTRKCHVGLGNARAVGDRRPDHNLGSPLMHLTTNSAHDNRSLLGDLFFHCSRKLKFRSGQADKLFMICFSR